MKELLSKIYFKKQKFLRSLQKSNTPVITAFIESNITNPYNYNWFKKNLIDEDQFEDFFASESNAKHTRKQFMCDFVGSYLKQLYIIITGGKENTLPEKQYLDQNDKSNDSLIFLCGTQFPTLNGKHIDEEHKEKLDKIFPNFNKEQDATIDAAVENEKQDAAIDAAAFEKEKHDDKPTIMEIFIENYNLITQKFDLINTTNRGGTRRRIIRTVKRTKK